MLNNTALTVGFDVSWMSGENTGGGVFQYSFRLISALVEYTDINLVVIISAGGIGIFDHLKGCRNFREVVLRTSHLFQEVVKSEEIDVVHTPLQRFYNCTFSVPMITTLHDLQHFHYPVFFTEDDIRYRNTFYKKSAEFSERVVASFRHVKDDIVRFYGISEEKIDVCPLGLDTAEPVDQTKFARIKGKYRLPEKYLFYSANTWRHKNHEGLIKALKVVHEKYGTKIALLCTGQKNEDYYPELQSVVNELNLGEFVSFTGYIPEGDMHIILKNATLVVIPTLYEAGSFPLMEAMAYDVPVICSNVTSLPSTIGDERFTFDPKNEGQMAEKIKIMLKDDKLMEENRKNSRKKIKEGGWDKVVGSFVSSYTKAVKGFKEKKDASCLIKKMHNFELLINKTIEQKEVQLNLRRKEREALRNSLIWKVTKPLRAIGRIFK